MFHNPVSCALFAPGEAPWVSSTSEVLWVQPSALFLPAWLPQIARPWPGEPAAAQISTMHQQALGPRGKILGAHGGTAGRRNDGMLRTTQQNFSAAVMDAAECGPDLGKGRKVGEFAVPLAANDLDEETLMHHHGSTVVAEKQVSSHVQDATGVTAPRRRSFANPANDFAAGGASGTDAAALRAALTGQHVTPDHTVIDANLRASTATVRGVRLSAADGNTPVGVSSTSSSGHTPSSKPDGHVASSGLRRVGSSQRRVGSDSCMGASDDGVTTSAVVAVTKSRGGRRGSGDGQAKIAFEASDTASKKPLVKTSGLRARWLKRKTGSGGDGSSGKRGVKGPTRVKALWSKVARYTTFLSTLRQLKDDAELKKVRPRPCTAVVPWNTVAHPPAQIFGRTITARELDRFALRTKWMVHPERGWRKMWDILLVCIAWPARLLVLMQRVVFIPCSPVLTCAHLCSVCVWCDHTLRLHA